MRSASANLIANAISGSPTIASALKVTRSDGQIFGFTSHDITVTISGVVYDAEPGLDLRSIVMASGLNVGTLNLSTLNDGTIFNIIDIRNGLWDNSEFLVFRYNFNSVADGVVDVIGGMFGEVTLMQGMVTAELRDLRQMMQYDVGAVSSRMCRDRLGGPHCRKDLTLFTYTGTFTGVTSGQIMTDALRLEAEMWFNDGEMHINNGLNAGTTKKIKTFANGRFVLSEALAVAPTVGTSYTAIAGCLKRRQLDCRDKFGNVVNFYGEPDENGADSITQRP